MSRISVKGISEDLKRHFQRDFDYFMHYRHDALNKNYGTGFSLQKKDRQTHRCMKDRMYGKPALAWENGIKEKTGRENLTFDLGSNHTSNLEAAGAMHEATMRGPASGFHPPPLHVQPPAFPCDRDRAAFRGTPATRNERLQEK